MKRTPLATALAVVLMVFAFKNDIERQWPNIVRQVAGE